MGRSRSGDLGGAAQGTGGLPWLEAFTDRLITRRGVASALVLWLIAAVAVSVLAAAFPAPSAVNPSLPASAQSTLAAQAAARAMPAARGSIALIVFHRPGGLTVADRAEARALAGWLRSPAAPAGITSVADPFAARPAARAMVSRDGSTLFISAVIDLQDPSSVVKAIRNHAGEGTGSLQIRLTGPAGLTADAVEIFTKADVNLELLTVLVVLTLLGLVYRAPLLALTPVVAVGWAYSIARSLLVVGEHVAGLSVDGEAAALVTVLLFGAGTDYTLFIISRYRAELTRWPDPYAAMRAALHGIAEVILASGGVVLLATLTLLLAQYGTYHDFGVALSTCMAVMLLAGLTLIPPMLVLFGRAAFWPRVPHFGDPEPRSLALWQDIGSFVSKRPATAAIASTVALLGLTAGVLGYGERFDLLQSFLKPTGSAQGYDLLRAGFGAGSLAPTTVVITPNRGAIRLEGAVLGVSRALAAAPNIASVRPHGVSRDGATAVLSVTFLGDPYAATAINSIPDLRAQAEPAIAHTGGGQILVGGETSVSYDTRSLSDRDTRIVVIAVLLLIALVLGLLLRSAIAPLFLLPISALGYGAAFGLIVMLNRAVLGSDTFGNQVALDLFVFLSALGADYNIFLLTRVREEARDHTLPEAVRRAVAATGGVITSAGVILASTFMVLSVLPERDVVELGIGVALGVMLDTFVVRSLLVPGVTLLLGPRAWWPSHVGSRDPDKHGRQLSPEGRVVA